MNQAPYRWLEIVMTEHRTYDEFDMPYHAHDRYELFYCIDGQASLLMNDQVVLLGSNQFVILQPKVVHKVSWTSRISFYTIEFVATAQPSKFLLQQDSGFLQEFQQFLQDDQIKLTDTSNVLCLLEKLTQHLKNSMDLYTDCLLYCIFQEILYMYRDQRQRRHIGNFTINSVLTFLNNSYDKDLGAEDIARHAQCSQQYLNKLFHKYFGMSVMRYLNHIRIHKSLSCLTNASFSIRQVAKLAGFPDAQNYTRHFKEVMNCTPKEYRDQSIVQFRKYYLSEQQQLADDYTSIVIDPILREPEAQE